MSLTTASLASCAVAQAQDAMKAAYWDGGRLTVNRLFSRDSQVLPELHVIEAVDEDLPTDKMFKIKLYLNQDSPRGCPGLQVVLKTNNTDFRFVRKAIRQAFGNGVAIALD